MRNHKIGNDHLDRLVISDCKRIKPFNIGKCANPIQMLHTHSLTHKHRHSLNIFYQSLNIEMKQTMTKSYWAFVFLPRNPPPLKLFNWSRARAWEKPSPPPFVLSFSPFTNSIICGITKEVFIVFFFLSFLSLFIGIGDLYPFKLLLRLKFFFWAK